ncbi:MAG: S9 family peptidase [Gemmatimonadales bacterium]|nr:MAG: S9 family peptidase [Gemmatimonadales bacterium]
MTFDVRRVAGLRWALLAGALLATAPAGAAAQSQAILAEGYLTPPDEVAALVASNRHENVILSDLSPNARFFLNSESEGMPSLAQLATPYHRLGGVALDPAANRTRGFTTGALMGLELIDASTGESRSIQVPAGARVSGSRWSPDGSQVAFLVHTSSETHVHVADVSNGRARQVTRSPLLATRVTSVEWSGDSRYIFAVVLPDNRGAEPVRPAQPATPLVRVASSDENRLRTYPSLLKDPHDQALFEYYTTGQLVRIEVSNRRVEKIGEPAMYESLDASPAGDMLRIRTTSKPFSYIVPASQFADREEIIDLSATQLHEVASRDLRLGVQGQGGGDNGNNGNARRSLTWRPDGQGLSFLQREPAPERPDADTTDVAGDSAAAPARTQGNQGGNNNARKDRVMHWLPPFGDDDQVVVYESETEIRSVQYSADMRWLFLAERVRSTDRVYAVHLDDPDTRYVISEADTEEFLEAPGSLLTTSNAMGAPVVRVSTDGDHVYLSGTRLFENPDEDAPRPFVDRVAIRTGEKERIFESAADAFERVTAVLDDDLNRIMIARETPTTVPDSWLLDRTTGQRTQMTRNQDHHPEITAARRERLTVTRADGFSFKVDVTLPPGYVEGTRLPAMFWFYPREYATQEAYDRTLRTWNRNRFPTVGARSMEILTAAGYAVVQPDHPIVGPSDRMNDNYITDLRMNHLAVIDALDARGWIDRQRLALGGHSYGGFGTINAMVQSPYFRAGIAGAPNSNRLLTPIGFQGERRPLWEARETYLEMSPFLYAERLSGALLIYHGEDDQNVGTFPDNSWRLIHALNGLGKTAALYMYPYEDHGQVARETLLDMWARWVAWLDHYVKDADVTTPPAPVTLVADDDADGDRNPERPAGGGR